jgi:hydroxymethylpyrimidine pyrophosphatase-like HAD family hydrolase
MRYRVLVCDYDGTIAHDGRVAAATVVALERVTASGRRLVLVTGRERSELAADLDRFDLFDRIVTENGAVVLDPTSGQERLLTEPADPRVVEALRRRGVRPLIVGRAIVATREPYEGVALQAIRELGLELEIIFNKGAVMILPAGVTKATGLEAALADLGTPAGEAVGVGDAENDHAFLRLCGLSAAVGNALPALKQAVDIVLDGEDGAGVAQLVDRLIRDDLGTAEGGAHR